MPKWNTITERELGRITNRLKRKRVDHFVRRLDLGPDDRILDLGSEAGSYLARFYPYPENIVLADLSEEPMRAGVERYGLRGYVVIPEDGPLPIGDGEYAAVWCNSAIEHVTVPSDQLLTVGDRQFRARAERHQEQFAAEIRRIGRGYFVQTPYRHLPIEAHSWLPGVQYLRQEHRLTLARGLNRIWVKQWWPNFHLFDKKRFRRLFPDATAFEVERVLGLPKSLIAIRAA